MAASSVRTSTLQALAPLESIQLVPSEAGKYLELRLPPAPATASAGRVRLAAPPSKPEDLLPEHVNWRLKMACSIFASGGSPGSSWCEGLRDELQTLSLANLQKLKRALVAAHPRGWELARHEALKDPKDGPRKAQQVERTLSILTGDVFADSSEGRTTLARLASRVGSLDVAAYNEGMSSAFEQFATLDEAQALAAEARGLLTDDPKALRRLDALDQRISSVAAVLTPLRAPIDEDFARLRQELREGKFDFDAVNGRVGDPDTFFQVLFNVHAPPRRKADVGPDGYGYMPTPFMGLRDAMKHLNLGPDDVVADLGCGAGHALQTFAHMTGCRGFGVELDAGLAKAATDALATTGLSEKVEVRCGDATEVDLSEATVVYMFNPFKGEVLDRVMDRIMDAARTRPLKICTTGPIRLPDRPGLRRVHSQGGFCAVNVFEADPALCRTQE